MPVQPYLNFNGRCEEALAFYREAVGAEVVSLLRFKESPPDAQPATGNDDKVMHAHFRVRGSDLFASDGPCNGSPEFKGITLSTGVATVEEGQRLFDALAAGGQVQMPFAPAFWTAGFGMLTDKFGVPWMVNVDHGGHE